MERITNSMSSLKTILSILGITLVIGFSTYFDFKYYGLVTQIALVFGNMALLYWGVIKQVKQLINQQK